MKRGRRPKPVRGAKFEVTLAPQSVALLQRLANRGVYGRSPAEVGGRLIEQGLQQFIEGPKFRLEDLRKTEGSDDTSE